MSVAYDVRIKQSAWKQALEIYTNTKKVMEQEKINQMYATGRIMQGMEGNAAFSMFHNMEHNMNQGLYQVGLERVARMKTMLEENNDQIDTLLTICEGFLNQIQEDTYVPATVVASDNKAEINGGILSANYSKLNEIKFVCEEISSEACDLKKSLDAIMASCSDLVDNVSTYHNEVSNAYMKLNRVINYKVAIGLFLSGLQALEEDINIALRSLFSTVEEIPEVRDKNENSFMNDITLRNLFKNDERFNNWCESDIDSMIDYIKIEESGLLSSLYATSRYSSSDYEKVKETLLSLCEENKEIILCEMLLRDLIEEDGRFDIWSTSDISYVIDHLKTTESEAFISLYEINEDNSSDFEKIIEDLLTICAERGELLLGEKLLRESIENDGRFKEWDEIEINNRIEYIKTTRSALLVEFFTASKNNASDCQDLKEMLLTHDFAQEDLNASIALMIENAIKEKEFYDKQSIKAETGDNETKYNDWYYAPADINGAWCSVFVLWCANTIGWLGEESILPPRETCKKYPYNMEGVRNVVAWYVNRGKYQSIVKNTTVGVTAEVASVMTWNPNYTPHNGDFIVFHDDWDHIGIVIGYDPEEQRVFTIEGNVDANIVIRSFYLYNNGGYIQGFCDNGGTETNLPIGIDPDSIDISRVGNLGNTR